MQVNQLEVNESSESPFCVMGESGRVEASLELFGGGVLLKSKSLMDGITPNQIATTVSLMADNGLTLNQVVTGSGSGKEVFEVYFQLSGDLERLKQPQVGSIDTKLSLSTVANHRDGLHLDMIGSGPAYHLSKDKGHTSGKELGMKDVVAALHYFEEHGKNVQTINLSHGPVVFDYVFVEVEPGLGQN